MPVVLKVDPEVVVVVTKPSALFLILGFLLISIASEAAVLPEERADVLFHSYSGGGIDITGPAMLVRKTVSDNVSLSAKYYVDTISSASIDVEVILGASSYEEERVESAFTVEYLNEKTLMSFGYTDSEENDFSAGTFSFGISQDIFGDLTTISMGYAHGSNDIGKTGSPLFARKSKTDNFKLGITQVFTKNLVTQTALAVIQASPSLYKSY